MNFVRRAGDNQFAVMVDALTGDAGIIFTADEVDVLIIELFRERGGFSSAVCKILTGHCFKDDDMQRVFGPGELEFTTQTCRHCNMPRNKSIREIYTYPTVASSDQ